MRYKLTILLVVLNVALFGSLWYLNKFGSTQERLQDAARLILTPGFSSRIDHFTLESAALDDRWELKREGEKWEGITQGNSFATRFRRPFSPQSVM